jgi:FtsH-binding integral membrane protein
MMGRSHEQQGGTAMDYLSHASPAERSVSEAEVHARSVFIVRTYNHLLGAVLAFTGIEIALFKTGMAEPIARAMLGTHWIVVLGAFMLVSWLASSVAHRVTSKAAQYAALAGYVVAEALVFVPMLFIVRIKAPDVLQPAVIVTAAGFLALTIIGFMTRKDFSFLGGLLRWIGVGALLAIGAGLIFGFTLGTWFSVGMIVFAGAAILYNTSNVLLHFPEDRYVAASLELFASVVLLLWYVLRLFLRARD